MFTKEDRLTESDKISSGLTNNSLKLITYLINLTWSDSFFSNFRKFCVPIFMYFLYDLQNFFFKTFLWIKIAFSVTFFSHANRVDLYLGLQTSF